MLREIGEAIREVYLLITAIIVSSVILVFFNDPPSFPLPDSEDPIDCLNIRVNSISTDKSRIKVNYSVQPFIQYPPEVSHYLLQVNARQGLNEMNFRPSQFWDLESDLNHTSFCVLSTLDGHFQVSVTCHGHLLSKAEVEVQSVDIYPIGWSRAFHSIDNALRADAFCIENRSIIFFTPQTSKLAPLRLGFDSLLNVTNDARSLATFRTQTSNPNLITSQSIIIDANPTEWPMVLLDVIIPYFGSYFHSIGSVPHVAFLLRNQTSLVSDLTPLKPSAFMYQDGTQCFSSARFLRASGSAFSFQMGTTSELDGIAQLLKYASSFRDGLFSQLRSLYTIEKTLKYSIILDEIAAKYIDNVKIGCPFCNISILKNGKKPISEVAAEVGRSEIFIGGNITSLIGCIFLERNSTMIELIPDHSESLMGTFASRGALNYFAIPSERHARKCTDYNCYFSEEFTYNEVKGEEIEKLVWNLTH